MTGASVPRSSPRLPVCDMLMQSPVWTAACIYSLLSGSGATSLPFAGLARGAGVTRQGSRHTAQPRSWEVQTHLYTSHALFFVQCSVKTTARFYTKG